MSKRYAVKPAIRPTKRVTNQNPARGFFVAGTDTGVGKTLIASALLSGLGARGLRVCGMKPVAAGAVRRGQYWINDDVEQLRAAGNVTLPGQWINPYCFAPPVAPHIAAAEAGVSIRMRVITAAYARLAAHVDVVVVEGAGGLLVPLGRRSVVADIPASLNLPVVLVVGVRLGCINHALLAGEALQTRKLRFAGWIANVIDPGMARREQNIEALRNRIAAPLLGVVGHAAHPRAARVRAALDISALYAAI